jgi:hypothetical protein
MKRSVVLMILYNLYFLSSQGQDSLFKVNIAERKIFTETSTTKPEVFTSGFIDIFNNGQVNAAARLLRLQIGEPGRWAIPISFYSGVSANNFQNLQFNGINRNYHLVNGLLNPMSGALNISLDNLIYLGKNKKVTTVGLLYQLGTRLLTAFKKGVPPEPGAGEQLSFFNSFVIGGIYFQTGAWDRNNTENLGLLWFSVRYMVCQTTPKQLIHFFERVEPNGIYFGLVGGGGIEINKLVNIKLLYYHYRIKPDITDNAYTYQFSFNYSLR